MVDKDGLKESVSYSRLMVVLYYLSRKDKKGRWCLHDYPLLYLNGYPFFTIFRI